MPTTKSTMQQENVAAYVKGVADSRPRDAAPPVAEADLVDFLDYRHRRQALLDRVRHVVETLPPTRNDRYTLSISDVKYRNRKPPTMQDHRAAIIGGRTLSMPIVGTYELRDNATGKVVNKVRRTIVNVPWMTDYGTFVRNGNEYVVRNQLRLDPGVFVRHSNDGFPEAQINVRARTGSPFRTYMEPETGIYHMKIRGRKVMLYPVLREMGVDDDRIKAAWGGDVWKANAAARVPAHTTRWLVDARARGAQYLAAASPQDQVVGLAGALVPDDDPDERTDIPDDAADTVGENED